MNVTAGQVEPTMPSGEQVRCDHSRLRRRMLYGLWEPDLREQVISELNSLERADAWGRPDVTGNIFAPTCRALSTLYTPEPPRPTGASTRHELVLDAVKAGGLWELMIRGQRDTIGMREWLVRVDPLEDPSAPLGWTLSFRPAYPDRICATPKRGAPDQPASIREAVYVELDPIVGPRWYWECWAIEGPEAPYHRWETDSGTVVGTPEAGEAYPYYDENGAPVLPYSLYHAERTGYLWDPYEWLEIVEGSLRLGVLWTFFGHLIRNASWPQRYMAGLTVASDTMPQQDDTGTPVMGPRQRVRAVADPALVLQLHTDPESTVQPLIGAFPLAADPQAVCAAIGDYERRITGLAGIDPASVRRDSGDPRSGYAITVSRDAQIEAQKRYKPQFLRGDLETLRVAAAVLGSAAGALLPGTGYEIEYGPEAEATAPADGAAAAGALPGAVQDTALNGAQVQALVQIVQAVAAGQLPRDAAIAIIARSFQVDTTEATALLGSAGAGFHIDGGNGGTGRQAGSGSSGPVGDGNRQAPSGGVVGSGADAGAGGSQGGAQDGAGYGGG